MSLPNSNVATGAPLPSVILTNSSSAANVDWALPTAYPFASSARLPFPLQAPPLSFPVPTTFPFARAAIQTSASSSSSTDAGVAALLAAQIAQTSNAATLQTLYATLNANACNSCGMGGDQGMLASLPFQAVQPVSTWQDVHSGPPHPATSQHQLNPFQLHPAPISFPSHGGLLSHGFFFQSNLGSDFAYGNFYMPGAHLPDTRAGGDVSIQDSTASFGAKPERFVAAVVPRRRGKERRVVLTLAFLTPYFDRSLDAVSESLGLSRSTIKAVAPRHARV